MLGHNIHRSYQCFKLFASRSVPGPYLPASVSDEAEAAWGKVVAIVNNKFRSGSFESQLYPLFAKRVTEPLMLEGKNFLNSFCSYIRIVTVSNL